MNNLVKMHIQAPMRHIQSRVMMTQLATPVRPHASAGAVVAGENLAMMMANLSCHLVGLTA
jgi:adenylyl- and sulfurtransferase ThiI